MPNVECPDPDKAPPRPTTPATTASSATTPKPTTRLKKTTPKKTKITTTTKKPRISKIIINGSITAIAGKFAGRPGKCLKTKTQNLDSMLSYRY